MCLGHIEMCLAELLICGSEVSRGIKTFCIETITLNQACTHGGCEGANPPP